MQAINPNWNVPKNIHAFTTTREGGVSLAPYLSFNLGDHVGDDKSAVKNAWGLREKDSVIILLDKTGKVQFVKEGKLTDDEVKEVISRVTALIAK